LSKTEIFVIFHKNCKQPYNKQFAGVGFCFSFDTGFFDDFQTNTYVLLTV